MYVLKCAMDARVTDGVTLEPTLYMPVLGSIICSGRDAITSDGRSKYCCVVVVAFQKTTCTDPNCDLEGSTKAVQKIVVYSDNPSGSEGVQQQQMGANMFCENGSCVGKR